MNARNDSELNATRNPTTVEPKSEREVVVRRTFNAPARIVFQAWTTPALFKQWWIPKSAPCSLLSYDADIRTGGGYRLVFSVDGTKTMAFFGKYIEVTPHSRIVWTNDESGEDGAVTTVTLEEKGDKTLLVLHELYRTKEARDAGLASGAYDGMEETFGQLDEVLVTLGAKGGAS
ncbi:SRPBCC family protein [Sorangium cellulosum]|uniref:SRPBCC family protein n=1 Tax=Sorangium TaxID=39643 RepID=UPI001F2A780D|nr:SRPBCC family protein [Sorangium cellulosum]